MPSCDLGADGRWCAPRSSKPMREVKSLLGEFDPHMPSPEPQPFGCGFFEKTQIRS